MKLINCKQYAQDILDEVKNIPNKKSLWILTMANDLASESYIRGKIKDCEYCGIPFLPIIVEHDKFLAEFIKEGNSDPNVAGMIVQLPLPDGVDETPYIMSVTPSKDVDGFTPESHFKPCTPEGIMYVLNKETTLVGKRVLVVGRGNLVGKPIVPMLLDADCTITIAHSKTTNLDALLEQNDIIISAVGKPKLIDLKKCKAEIVIDVGVNRDENGKLCGDCYNFEDTGSGMKVTSVPGGIGLMTRAMLMRHVAQASSTELKKKYTEERE